MTTVRDIATYLEHLAPPSLAADYDNVGLLCGDPHQAITGVVTCLDVTAAVIDEAIAKGANLIVSHHPLIFGGINHLRPDDLVGRLLIKAIKSDIALYAIHTNLDFVLRHGVNEMLAQRLGWDIIGTLAPERSRYRWALRVPDLLTSEVIGALHEMIKGRPDETVARLYTDEAEVLLEGPHFMKKQIEQIASHYKAGLRSWPIQDTQATGLGAGILVQPSLPMSEADALSHLATVLKVPAIRHTELLGRSVSKVALCGGSGSFLLGQAKASGADLFVTGDYKYHQFFDADGDIVIADVGHYESEQFTAEGLQQLLSSKFTNFAVFFTQVVTNPVHYFIQ